MGYEIERKFLVRKDLWFAVKKPEGTTIKQGYLLIDPEKVIRIRATDTTGFLTIKGKAKNFSRPEYEFGIPLQDALELLDLFTSCKIDKVRYRIPFEGKTWEVDEFFGENDGLIIAEIELSNEAEDFVKPNWIGEEVTSDFRYYNSWISEHPYPSWENYQM